MLQRYRELISIFWGLLESIQRGFPPRQSKMSIEFFIKHCSRLFWLNISGLIRRIPAFFHMLKRQRLHLVMMHRFAFYKRSSREPLWNPLCCHSVYRSREGEILGLTWDCVDFDNGVLTINKQMQLHQDKDMKAYQLVSTKNSKARTIITAAPFVMERLKHRKVEQTKEWLLTAHWGNRADLYLQTQPETTSQSRPYIEHLRELLHPLADQMRVFMTWGLHCGDALLRDDIKTVQGNLGQATATFTQDVYGHVIMQMTEVSAAHMEAYIKTVSMG